MAQIDMTSCVAHDIRFSSTRRTKMRQQKFTEERFLAQATTVRLVKSVGSHFNEAAQHLAFPCLGVS